MKLRKLLQRFTAAAVAGCMALSLSMPTLAATWNIANGDIHVSYDPVTGRQSVSQNGSESADDAPLITGNGVSASIVLNGASSLTLKNLEVNAATTALIQDGDATITLDGRNITLSGGSTALSGYSGDLTITGSGLLTLKGECSVSGAITLENGAKVTMTDSYGTALQGVTRLKIAAGSILTVQRGSDTGLWISTDGSAEYTPTEDDIKGQIIYLNSDDSFHHAFPEKKIKIDETAFPDDAFRNYVLLHCDTDWDGFLSDAERYSKSNMDLSMAGNYKIESLTGIELFPKLTYLNCSYQNLTSLDVSANTKLESLICYGNQLTTLNLSENPALEILDCSNNQLTTLDVSANTQLERLFCYQNQLVGLDVSNNTKLETLYCGQNQLVGLDVSKNTKLEILNAAENQRTIQLDANNRFDLKNLEADGFDLSRVVPDSWEGGTVGGAARSAAGGKILTVDPGVTQVTYQYETGSSNTGLSKATFYLQVVPYHTVGSWQTDGTSHWHQCQNHEGEILDKAEHTLDEYGVCTVCKYVSGGIPIDEAHFKDENFRTYLKNKVDGDHNDVLSARERAKVETIDVRKKGIASLVGIEYFPELKNLYCINNQLTSLDVSRNTALKVLACSENKDLTSLNVSGCTALTALYCNNNALTSLDVSSCTALTSLECFSNDLTSLNVSGCTALTSLICYENALTSLDVRANTALTNLSCSGNDLTGLDVSKNTALTSLICYSNDLTSLDVRANTALTSLSCSSNDLTSLDVRANTALTSLECSYNQLVSLDVSKNTALTTLRASGNQRTIQLDANNRFDLKTLKTDGFDIDKVLAASGGSLDPDTGLLTVEENPFQYQYNSGNGNVIPFKLVPEHLHTTNAAWEHDATTHWKTCTGKLASGEDCGVKTAEAAHTLDAYGACTVCGYDPGAIPIDEDHFKDANFRTYLRDNVSINTDRDNVLSSRERAKVEVISVREMGIASLEGIEHFPNLKDLYCGKNQLKELDVSKNTALEVLECSENKDLTSLNVSGCTALTSLDCYNNALTSLDVSANTALESLYCSKNQLKKLDVSENTALKALNCHSNALTSLKVSGCTALTVLTCYSNALTSLDVSSCTALTSLICYDNALTSLDVRANTALTNLSCGSNALTSLDVSKNTALTSLDCFSNQLTSLNVRANTALTELFCGSNDLTSLDVRANTALTYLGCDDNDLTTLDVSKNTALTYLGCSQNQLTTLDVSRNTALTTLDCSKNQLASLDVSANTALTDLSADYNGQTIRLDANNQFDLKTLPGFDPARVTECSGGTVDKTTGRLTADSSLVTYRYDCGKGTTYLFAFIPEHLHTPGDTWEHDKTTHWKECTTALAPDISCEVKLAEAAHDTKGEYGTCSVCGYDPNAIPLDAAHFPDKKFREYLEINVDKDDNEGVLSSQELHGATHIMVHDWGIASFKGIEYFPNLEQLDCSENQLTELDVSKNTNLKVLNCSNNSLTKLDVRANPELTRLACENNQLTELDVSGHTALTYLNCNNIFHEGETASFGKLTSLKVSGCTALTQLACDNNALTTLDLSSNTKLENLWCSDNQLACLNVGHTALENLFCTGNGQTIRLDANNQFDLSNLPGFDPVKVTECYGGEVDAATGLLTVHDNGSTVTYQYDCGKGKSAYFTFTPEHIHTPGDTWKSDGTFHWKECDTCGEKMAQAEHTFDAKGICTTCGFDRKAIRVSLENFPSVDLAHGFVKYVADEIDTNHDGWLDLDECNAVTTINIDANVYEVYVLEGIEYFPNLEKLYCSSNKLTGLDVSKNPKLEELDCSNNSLTELDVSGLTALKVLRCYNAPALTDLDVSDCTALEELYCYNDPALTGLELSSNTALKVLNCNGDTALTGLELGRNTALTMLNCYSIGLTGLDVSANTALTQLICSHNKLTELNVSENTKLTYLDCSFNQLKELDVRANTALATLSCGSNQLTSLDVSRNTALNSLSCGGNVLEIGLNEYNQFDLTTLPGFDVDKAGSWWNGTVSGTTLTATANGADITYEYNVGYGEPVEFTLRPGHVHTAAAGAGWQSDDTQHWKLCADHPDVKVERGSHDTAGADGTCSVCGYDAGAIKINEENFPDEIFQTYVSTLFDTDNGQQDGWLSTHERNAVRSIGVGNLGVTSLKGIEHFPNLTSLVCNDNPLTGLDVSHNEKLEELDCHNTGLTSLNTSANTALTSLICYSNDLTSLDVGSNIALTELNCSTNHITSLNVRANTALTGLYCGNNPLTSLDVSANTELLYLTCDSSQLTELDLSNNEMLKVLDCSDNQLTKLDVSANTALTVLHCSANHLTSLDVDANTALNDLECGDNALVIGLDEHNQFDLNDLTATGFDINKVVEGSWEGGTVSGTTLTANADAASITYQYNTGYGEPVTFTLQPGHVHAAAPDAGWEHDDTSHWKWCAEGDGAEVDKAEHDFGEYGTCTVCGYDPEAPIAVDAETFPDKAFRKYVAENLDLDGDGKLDSVERKSVRTIDVSGLGITWLKGIENFPNLTDLNCEFNKLTSLDVRKNTALTNLDCAGNLLEIGLDEHNQFDLNDLTATGFDINKVVEGSWEGGTVSGTTLTVNADAVIVSYQYDTGYGEPVTFILQPGHIHAAAPDAEWQHDSLSHWKLCAEGDGVELEKADHDLTGEGGICSVCGYDPIADLPTDGGDAFAATTFAIIDGVVLGGALAANGYVIVTELVLRSILPKDAAVPETRAQLAALLWQTAGKPEPAAVPAFVDLTDPDTAAAAQWCVEQGLLEASDGRFDPDGRVSRVRVIRTWRTAFPKK